MTNLPQQKEEIEEVCTCPCKKHSHGGHDSGGCTGLIIIFMLWKILEIVSHLK